MGRGKRNATIITSDDDEEDEDFLIKSKPKRVAKSALTVNPKRAKRGLISNSCSRLQDHSHANGFDEIKRFCKEFDEGITGFKVVAGHLRSEALWVDKYKPKSLDDLAVHKKKVEEVKNWFEGRLTSSLDKSCNFVLLIAGPAGAGKSATVHAVATHLGAQVFEWDTPTPTIWHEHLHTSNAGLRYMSKLDEFEHFVERIRKYGSVHSSLTEDARTSVILLIDDLPVVNGKVAYGRLRRCLHHLVQSVRIPTAVLISEYAKADSADYNTHYWEELQLSLQNAGACKVTLNPVTVNSIKKTLVKVCKMEMCEVNSNQLDLIAKASGGDIRHAITSLQYFCLKPHPVPWLSSSKSMHTPSRDILDEISVLDNEQSLHFGRDETLSLFHALGKFLHNKRDTETTNLSENSRILLKEKFLRLPLKIDAPELVLRQSHGQARPIADFLHENVLDFVHEEAIDDVSLVASYMSDADFLLASLNCMTSRSFDAENVLQSAAASIAVRGVLFGNSHPAPPRWHTIRRPKLWQVEQSLRQNKYQMADQRASAFNGVSLSDPSVFCTELKPLLKWLEHRAYEGFEDQGSAEYIVEDETLDNRNLDEKFETSEDEIED